MTLSELIYRCGVLLRNRKIFSRHRLLLESQHWPIERLREYQLTRLQAILQHAYSSSEYYRKQFDAAGVKPNEIRSLDDLSRIPELSKQELLDNLNAIQVKNYPERLYYSETSGSTGRPLVFYRNQDWDAWHNASVFRGYSWHGVRPWDRNGYLWGYNFSPVNRAKTRVLDLLQNRFRLFSYDDDEIRRFVGKLRKATYLGGYSSMIYEIAKAINCSNIAIDPERLKLVKGTSEKIFDKYQEEARRAFGRKIVSEYGAAETGIIAFECPDGNMHVNMETCIVETEEDQILVTNLVSHSLPIIRYRLGDYVKHDRDAVCSCGRQHEIIREVTGRIGQPIFGREGRFPSLSLYYVFKNLATDHKLILNYQAVQNEKGRLDLHIEGALQHDMRTLLHRELARYFVNDLDIVILENADLRSRTRKKCDFVSTIN